MAATNYTPIILYHSTTATASPVAGNLNSGELAINITDGKLFYKDNGGSVQLLASKGTGTIGGSNTQVQYNSSGSLAGSANLVFDGTTLTANQLALTTVLDETYGGTGLTSYTTGDLIYASGSNTLGKLSIGTNTYILTSTGSVPQWSAPSAITVATANNLAGGLGGSVPYQSSASTTTFLSIGTANQVMTSTGTAPQWTSSLTINDLTLSGGTANGVTYLNGSKVLTSGSALTFDGTEFKVNAASGNVLVQPSNVANAKLYMRHGSIGNNNGFEVDISSNTIFLRAGTEAMRLTSTGLGIGTSSPADTLETAGDIRITSATPTLKFSETDTTDTNYQIRLSGGNLLFQTNNNAFNLSATRLTLDSSGNVGIGTSSPGQLLELYSTTPYIRIQDNQTVVTSSTQFGGIEWRTADLSVSGANRITASITAKGDGTFDATDKAPTALLFSTHASSGVSPVERMRIDSSGNVGIGTSTPTDKLDVNGGITISTAQTLKITGSDSTTTQSVLRFWRGGDNDQTGSYAGFRTKGDGANGVDALIVDVNSSEVMRIDSSGNVGIGTSSPNRLLDIATSNAGGSTLVSLVSATDGNCQLLFGDTASDTQGKVFYNNSGDYMAFNTAGSERMRIDSSGNLLVGKTSSSVATIGAELRDGTTGNYAVTATAASQAPILVNRTTTDGELIQFRKDNTIVGSIASSGGGVHYNGVGLGLRMSGTAITPTDGSTSVEDATNDLGTNSARFKDLYLSGGVYLGGTGSANQLDDYEEGSFTPTFRDNNGVIGTVASAYGHYVKVGRVCTVWVNLNNIDSTGLTTNTDLRVADLPFTAVSLTGTIYEMGAGTLTNCSSTNQLIPTIIDSTDYIKFMERVVDNVNDFVLVNALTSGTSDIWATVTYYTTA